MRRSVITVMAMLAFFASAVAQNQNERVPTDGKVKFRYVIDMSTIK